MLENLNKDMDKEKVNDKADKIWNDGWTYIKSVVDTAREPFLILSKDLEVIAANNSFYSFFMEIPEKTEDKPLNKIGDGQWDSPHLRKLLKEILPLHTSFNDFEVDYEFPFIGRRIIMLNARQIFENIVDFPKLPPHIILVMQDITKQRLLEENLRNYAKDLEEKINERTKELNGRIVELEIFHRVTVDRENKMIELKKENFKLNQQNR